MAPSLQQRLQGAWDNVSATVLAQPGPFDLQTHLSNLLQNLPHRSSPPSLQYPGFRLHFPFPFAGLFSNKESKSRSISTSDISTRFLTGSSNGDHYAPNQVLDRRNGEEASPSLKNRHSRSSGELGRGTDGTSSYGDPISIASELQLLQKQLETSVLGSSGPASKEVLGRATWTFLHTLAAQFPEKPTRQQQRDVKELMAILSRLYPCKECADHFKEVLKANPVQAGSGMELAQWMCSVHNVVNRSLDKPLFPCQRVDARWGAMDCDEGACSLQGRMH